METRRLAAGTPVEETLDGLQRRLVQAEKGASKLSKHLQKYGFKSSTNDGKEMAKVGKVDGSSNTSKSSKMKVKESLQKSFEDMESRVNKMENTIHSLKIGMNGLEEEGLITKDRYDKEIIELRNKYLKEMKKVEEKLERANIESEELKRRDIEMKNELEHVIKGMRENQEILAEKDATIGDLEERIEKMTSQKNEAEVQLQREVTLRQSLEDAHDALLMRIRDMESVVDSERGQVNDLVSNYDNAKQEAVATREAFDSEHELRVQLEGLVSQQEQDIAVTKEKLIRCSEEKKHLENELSRVKRDDKAIRQKFELKNAAHDQLKASFDSLMKDNQKLHEALKIAATDNKALIAQHKGSAQREKDRAEQQQKIQDRLLDNAKEAVLRELEREKAATRSIENENTEIKTQLKNQQSLLAENEQKIKQIEQKYSIENGQLTSLVETLRKDKEMMVVQKNEKIFELQGIIEQIRKENADYEMTLRKVRDETARMERALGTNKQELEEIKCKLNSAEKNQLSQKQIESAFGEIVESKQKLAYENGLLQSKVNQMGIDLKDYDIIKTDYDRLKRKHQDLCQQYESVSEDLERIKSDYARKNSEFQKCKAMIEERENEMKMVAKSREETLKEMKRLSEHNESREGKLIAKITNTESKLKITDDDNKRLAKSFEAVMKSHSKLEATLEDLQITLGKKDNEIMTLIEERNASQSIVSELQSEMDNLQKKILCLEDVDSEELLAAKEARNTAEEQNKQFSDRIRRLEKENSLLKSDIEQLKVDIRKKVKQMEEDAKEREAREKEMDAKSHRHKEEMETDYLQQMEKLRDQLRNAQKKCSSLDEKDAVTKRKLKKLKDECFRLRTEVEDYKTDNENKSRRISDMAVTIEELKVELENAAYKRTQTDISTRQFEDEIEKEKFIRIEAESKYMNLKNKEKDLERQLKKATQQTLKANQEYKQAKIWFQGKVQELEDELDNARQTQYMLEQTNLEQEKLLESRTENAKSAVRASRLAINKLKSEVVENLWETKGLKQVLQSERDNAARATKKYEKLMESSARKVEELARELDRAHEKARKAR